MLLTLMVLVVYAMTSGENRIQLLKKIPVDDQVFLCIFSLREINISDEIRYDYGRDDGNMHWRYSEESAEQKQLYQIDQDSVDDREQQSDTQSNTGLGADDQGSTDDRERQTDDATATLYTTRRARDHTGVSGSCGFAQCANTRKLFTQLRRRFFTLCIHSYCQIVKQFANY